ncbi:MAG: hypothetical protein ABIV06_04195 [Thermoanaerobaculia bacterium]
MSSSAPSTGGVAEALARAAVSQPETPFLFYRNARGHFRWWSFGLAAAFLEEGGRRGERLSVKGVVVELEAVHLLGGFLTSACTESGDPAAAPRLPAPSPKAARDVWISWRPLADPAELALARWAIETGAAILLEPGAALHPELFAWARPTVVSGSADELCALAAEIEGMAPRFLRQRWLRQRARRLRLAVVSGEPSVADLARVEARWRALSPFFAHEIAPLSRTTLV